MIDPSIFHRVTEARYDVARYRRKLQRLEAQATRVTSTISDMPKGGSADSGATLAALCDARIEYERKLLAAENIQLKAEALVEQLPMYEDRMVLKLRYFEGRKWEGKNSVLSCLQDAGVHVTARQMYRIHGRALNAARHIGEEQ